MQATVLPHYGDSTTFRVQTVAIEDPAPDQVQVAVEAASVNDIDRLFRRGDFEVPQFPMILGRDVAGTVEAVGEAVTEVQVGDRVFGAKLGGPLPGSYAERVNVPATNVAHLPEGTSVETGAGLGHVGLAAWQGLIRYGDVAPGDTVLIHGGGGGLGPVGVQLAAAAGAKVIATSKVPSHRDRLRELGAAVTLDYTTDDLTTAVRSHSRGGVDTVLDPNFDEYAEVDVAVAAPNATISVLEYATNGASVELSHPSLRNGLWLDLDIQLVGGPNAPSAGDVLQNLGYLLETDQLEIDVAGVYSLDEIGAAHERLAAETFMGKLIVDPSR